MRAPVAVLSMLVTATLSSAAQDSLAAIAPKALCFHAKPKPACATFLHTNFGTHVVTPANGHGSWLRAVGDWGFMANVSTRAAIGASVFASADEAGFGLGPAIRYRHWMSPRTSLDVGVGTPLWAAVGTGLFSGGSGGEMLPGSILGLVRLNPAPWAAVTVRLEVLRRYGTPCDEACVSPFAFPDVESRMRFSFGMEAGEVPGLILTGAGGVALLVLARMVP